MNPKQNISAKSANMENTPITVLNVGVPESVSTIKSKALVSYVRALLYANMVAINNIAMIVGQSANAHIESVVAVVKSAPGALFVPIRNFEVDVVTVEAVKCANILGAVNYALNVMEVESALINCVVTDAPNVEAETYANMAETRTGVSHVMDRMYANMIKSKHNVSHARVDLYVFIRNVAVSVGNV